MSRVEFLTRMTVSCRRRIEQGPPPNSYKQTPPISRNPGALDPPWCKVALLTGKPCAQTLDTIVSYQRNCPNTEVNLKISILKAGVFAVGALLLLPGRSDAREQEQACSTTTAAVLCGYEIDLDHCVTVDGKAYCPILNKYRPSGTGPIIS